MPNSKFKRLQAQTEESIRRGRGRIEPAAAILIVTEGLVTEPAYLAEVRKRFSAPTVKIVVEPGGAGDPRGLAERALRIAGDRRRSARKGRIGYALPGKFDQLWIVFDTDAPLAHGRFHDGVGFAQAKEVRCAHSTPCFEFWLLLHHVHTTAPMQNCGQVVARLNQALGTPYSKEGAAAKELMSGFVDRLETAMKHANQVRASHAAAGNQPPCNPSTEMDSLITAIIAGGRSHPRAKAVESAD